MKLYILVIILKASYVFCCPASGPEETKNNFTTTIKPKDRLKLRDLEITKGNRFVGQTEAAVNLVSDSQIYSSTMMTETEMTEAKMTGTEMTETEMTIIEITTILNDESTEPGGITTETEGGDSTPNFAFSSMLPL